MIRKVCQLLEEKKYKLHEISKITNVNLNVVADIKRRKTWKHISCEYNF